MTFGIVYHVEFLKLNQEAIVQPRSQGSLLPWERGWQ